MDPDTHQITRENTKVVMIAAVNTAITRNRTTQIIDAWKKRANQNSVGLITNTICAQF
jgi:hypothetical protein